MTPDENPAEIRVKKIISIAVVSAVIALSPAAASGHSKKAYHHGPEAVVLLGAGIGAGAVIAGPVGAAVGGVAALVIGHLGHIIH